VHFDRAGARVDDHVVGDAHGGVVGELLDAVAARTGGQGDLHDREHLRGVDGEAVLIEGRLRDDDRVRQRRRPIAGSSIPGRPAQMWPGCVSSSWSSSCLRIRATVPAWRFGGRRMASTGPDGPISTLQAPSSCSA
jgi:hypothetical protein